MLHSQPNPRFSSYFSTCRRLSGVAFGSGIASPCRFVKVRNTPESCHSRTSIVLVCEQVGEYIRDRHRISNLRLAEKTSMISPFAVVLCLARAKVCYLCYLCYLAQKMAVFCGLPGSHPLAT